MLLLLIGVAAVAVNRIDEIKVLAGALNGRVVAKTRIASDLVELGQQIRYVDYFLAQASGAEQSELADRMVGDRLRVIAAKEASYVPLIDTDLERRLLFNMQRARAAYIALQRASLSVPLDGRGQDGSDSRLTEAFAAADRQARGLAHLAEAQARDAREKAAAIADEARVTVLGVSALAVTIGMLILLLLRFQIFRPLSQLTKALLALAGGRLDVRLFYTRRGDEIGEVAQAIDVFRTNTIALQDAHEALKAANHRADQLARHDALTGLLNRRMMVAAIQDAIERSPQRQNACAVLVLDLDRFKPINDIHGHGMGDKVLCAVAERISGALRGSEVAGRLGADEFAVVMDYRPGTDAPHRLAKRLIGAVTPPIEIDGQVVSVGGSVGVAVCPSDPTSAEQLLHAADLAMAKAKREQRGNYRFFEPDMDVQLRARADLEARLRLALERGDIRPHYQPLVDLRRDRLIGFEILARWHDGDLIRPPAEFIPVAEEAGLIPAMTTAVLRQACRDAQAWPEDLTLALNVTPAQIEDLAFPAELLDILAQERLAPGRLELEVTENALIGDLASAKVVMATLRQHGVRLSLDDFGTGYSSLHHLRNLKFDKIKIDRSFVQAMLTNPEAQKIVETILGLGRSLGISTLAEGIENADHLATLVAHGCDYGQGYHLGRPLPFTGVQALLAAGGTACDRAA